MDVHVNEMVVELDEQDLVNALILLIQDRGEFTDLSEEDFEMDMCDDVTVNRSTMTVLVRRKG